MEQRPETISFDDFMNREVAGVKSFEKLFELIDRGAEVGKIGKGSVMYHADDIRGPIENLLQKSERGEEVTEADFETVTTAHGIRNAVMRLLNQQALDKVA